MASSNTCWGIELGAGAVKALRLELDDDQLKVTDFVVVPHASVLSTPGIDTDDAMRIALGQLVSQRDFSGARVAVGVPGHASFARFAKLPPVEPKRVPDIVKFEAVQQIPFPLEEVEWDYQTFQSPESPDVEVGIFAIMKERLKHQLDLLADVGIEPDVVVPNPVADYNALAYDLEFTEKTPGTVILDVGTTSTDLIIAEAGRVWIRTFPLGGHSFTQALAEAFNLPYPKAERLKRDAQQTKHAKQVFQAMRPVFTDLVQKVQESIGYYQSLHRDAKLVRLVGLGSTFNIPGLRKYLKQQLGLDVYRLEQLKRVQADEDRKDDLFENAGAMTTALGLAIQGVGYETIDANLIPVEHVREAMWRRKTPWFAAAAVLALLAGGLMFLGWFMSENAARGVRPPGVIQEAASRAQTLSTRAREAGVIGGGTQNYTAPNMIALLEQPAFHAHIVRDVGELFQSAGGQIGDQQAGGGDRAFELIELETRYFPPDRPLRSMAAPSQQVRSRRGAAQAEPPAEREAGIDKPRIGIRVRARTPHPDAREFVLGAVQQWLNENARRDGVPYEIVSDPQTLLPWIREAQELAAADAPGAADQPAARERPRSDPRVQPAIDPHGHGGGEDEFGLRDLPPGVTITGGGEQGPTGSGRLREGSQELNRLAPLEAPADERDRRLSEVEMFWYIVLGDAGEQTEGDL